MAEIIRQYLEDDIELLWGSDYHETHTFYEDDGVTPIDTTNWDMTLYIKKSFPNGEEFDTIETDGVRIINTPISGQFNINLTKAEIQAYNFTTAEYRLAVDYGDGNVQVFRKGTIKVV